MYIKQIEELSFSSNKWENLCSTNEKISYEKISKLIEEVNNYKNQLSNLNNDN